MLDNIFKEPQKDPLESESLSRVLAVNKCLYLVGKSIHYPPRAPAQIHSHKQLLDPLDPLESPPDGDPPPA